jgi:hypothetical protein
MPHDERLAQILLEAAISAPPGEHITESDAIMEGAVRGGT